MWSFMVLQAAWTNTALGYGHNHARTYIHGGSGLHRLSNASECFRMFSRLVHVYMVLYICYIRITYFLDIDYIYCIYLLHTIYIRVISCLYLFYILYIYIYIKANIDTYTISSIYPMNRISQWSFYTNYRIFTS